MSESDSSSGYGSDGSDRSEVDTTPLKGTTFTWEEITTILDRKLDDRHCRRLFPDFVELKTEKKAVKIRHLKKPKLA
jgi:hypothetical protein